MGAQARSSGAYAALIPTEQGRAASMLNMVAGTPPILANTDLNQLSQLGNVYDMLRRYQSRAYEAELSPDLAAARRAAEQNQARGYMDIMSGNLTPALRKGLFQSIMPTLAATGISPSSTFGAMNLASLYGRQLGALQQGAQNQMNQYLAAIQAPAGGISGESAMGLRMGEAAQNRGAQNAWLQQLLGTAGQAQQGLSQLGMGATSAAAQQDAMNAASRNQLMGTLLGAGMGAAGGILGGPLGAMAGRAMGGLLNPGDVGTPYRY